MNITTIEEVGMLSGRTFEADGTRRTVVRGFVNSITGESYVEYMGKLHGSWTVSSYLTLEEFSEWLSEATEIHGGE